MTDVSRYDRYARWLGRRYEGIFTLLDRDDIYQVAMMALLNAKGDQPESWCKRQMRLAVYHEMWRLAQRATTEPLDEARAVGAPDVADTVVEAEAVERVKWAVWALPDAEYPLVQLRLMGVPPMQAAKLAGYSFEQGSQLWRLARQRLRRYMEEMAG